MGNARSTPPTSPAEEPEYLVVSSSVEIKQQAIVGEYAEEKKATVWGELEVRIPS